MPSTFHLSLYPYLFLCDLSVFPSVYYIPKVYFPISWLWINICDLHWPKKWGRSNDVPIPSLGLKKSCIILSWASAMRKACLVSNSSRMKTYMNVPGLNVGPRGEIHGAELPQLKSPAAPLVHEQAKWPIDTCASPA